MKQLKKIIPFLLAAVMACAMCTTALAAAETPDLEQKGSLKVTVQKDGKALSGGKLKLYQVASIERTDDGYAYAYTNDFANCGTELSSTQADNLTKAKASAWSSYAAKQKLRGTSLAVGRDGTATASDLELGLYLVCQGTAANGYTMSPTVVPVPLEQEDGSLDYSVEAIPKISTPGGSDDDNNNGNPNPNGTLPQTGQLWWPVSVLAAGGMLMYVIGWKLNRKRQ